MTDRDFYNQLSPQEQNIAQLVKEGFEPSFRQEDIERACKIASAYLLTQQKEFDIGFWHAVFSAITLPSAMLWIIGALILGVSTRLISFSGFDPMMLLFTLSPVPIITLAIRELSYRDENLTQLELVCKYSPSRIYFARLWVGILINTITIAILGAVVVTEDTTSLHLWLCSFIAMFLVGAVALFAMSWCDNALPLSALLAVWIVCSAFVVSQSEIIFLIEHLSNVIVLSALSASIAVFLSSALGASKKLYS